MIDTQLQLSREYFCHNTDVILTMGFIHSILILQPFQTDFYPTWVRYDFIRPSIQPTYSDAFPVILTNGKYFVINKADRTDNVSNEQLKVEFHGWNCMTREPYTQISVFVTVTVISIEKGEINTSQAVDPQPITGSENDF